MSTTLFILLSATTLLSAFGTYVPNDENLKRNGIQGRIYGGVDTSIEKIPYQVALLVYGFFGGGGSIYSSKIIITAAHCVNGINPRYISIRAGSSIWNSGGSVIEVSGVIEHKQYNNWTNSNDIALLLLKSPLKLSNSIKPIALATSEPKVGALAIVSGWGETESELEPLHLKSVEVNIWPRDICNKLYSGKPKISKEMICAAAPGKDSCQGDSGGPLVYNNELVGVVSFGILCADPRYPGVYVNVAVLRNWILDGVTKLLLNEQK